MRVNPEHSALFDGPLQIPKWHKAEEEAPRGRPWHWCFVPKWRTKWIKTLRHKRPFIMVMIVTMTASDMPFGFYFLIGLIIMRRIYAEHVKNGLDTVFFKYLKKKLSRRFNTPFTSNEKTTVPVFPVYCKNRKFLTHPRIFLVLSASPRRRMK